MSDTPTTHMDAADRLGTEKIGKLLLRFSIPAITGMIVNALYNVVDRIFVGRGVNEVALGGLSLVLPLMTITMSFSMLFGIGAANMISMRLGQGRRDEAENALNHCFWLLIGMGIILMAVELALLDPILSLLGAQEGSTALSYARSYYRIILFGQVFLLVGFGFSHCTRAQGFPTITMLSMFIGAGMNMILDPIFIFVFHWGVEGAAWATIISQLAAAIWILSFNFSKKAVIRLRLKTFKPSLNIVGQIMVFGSAQFFLQFVMSAVQLLYNSTMGWYGVEALGVANGGDIALSGMNINGSILMLILMPIFGINQGAQPILGYNYGAKKYHRVLRAYLAATAAATAIATLGFILAELFPVQLIRLFAPNGSPALMRFAPWAMRVMMIMLPLNGFQIVSSNFFVVTGRPKTSIVLSLMRQCIALIPCILIFSRIWGLWGAIAATPVADGVAFLFTGIMIIFELKKLRSHAPQ
ncbi:MATE family efflux transporter [Treponema primitia]|uniref:MATE family efflux transporter n=1 Tax=Treponema primitia TaxID=88058 RepID=UPI00025557EA|nr:MATE family efflux transporter [Treponema primitia]